MKTTRKAVTHTAVKRAVKKGVRQHESKQHPGKGHTALKLGSKK